MENGDSEKRKNGGEKNNQNESNIILGNNRKKRYLKDSQIYTAIKLFFCFLSLKNILWRIDPFLNCDCVNNSLAMQ